MNKTLYLYICIIVLTVASCDTGYEEKDLFGLWVGVHSGKRLVFKFRHDQTCELIYVSDDDESRVIVSGEYQTDFSKKPISLSIYNIPQLDHPLHTIFDFINVDSIKIAQFSPRWRLRPIAFNNNTAMVLGHIRDYR